MPQLPKQPKNDDSSQRRLDLDAVESLSHFQPIHLADIIPSNFGLSITNNIAQSMAASITAINPILDIVNQIATLHQQIVRSIPLGILESISKSTHAASQIMEREHRLVQAITAAPALAALTTPIATLVTEEPDEHGVSALATRVPTDFTPSHPFNMVAQKSGLIIHNGRLLTYTHPGNVSGRLLAKFLAAPNHFVGHKEIAAESTAGDPTKRVRWTIDELIRSLERDGLHARFKNIRALGYILESIE